MKKRLEEKPRDSFSYTLVQTRLDMLSHLWTEIRTVHLDIISQDEEEFESYLNIDFSRLHELHEEVQELSLDLLTQFPDNDDSTLRIGAPVVASSERELTVAKLPTVNLPTFAGEYKEWENFYDLFTTLVHNRNIANSVKLQYLKQCLTGPAADLVRDVTITNANYAPIWEALKTRFYKPWLIVVKHFKSLLNIPFLKRESAVNLRSFADEAQRIVRALKNLDLPVEQWDAWFVFLLAERLDTESRKAWETKSNVLTRTAIVNAETYDILHHIPKFKAFAEFLEARTQMLTAASASSSGRFISSPPAKFTQVSRKVHHVNSARALKRTPPKCVLCAGIHPLHKCSKFKAKSIYDRRADVRRLRFCFNCFGAHKFNECSSLGRCVTCKEKHHSLLHFDTPERPRSPQRTLRSDSESNINQSNASVNTARVVASKRSVILATALLTIIGPNGHQTRVRALLDQGSETLCVSDLIATLLNLPREKVHISLNGLSNDAICIARFATHFTIQSIIDPTFNLDVDALIVPKLPSRLPTHHVLELEFGRINEIALADPQFHIPDSIDVLLGADIYGQLIRSGLRSFPCTTLIAQNTILGWIISGPVLNNKSRRADDSPRGEIQTLHCVKSNTLDETLERFWRLEDLAPRPSSLAPEESECEKIFVETYSRAVDGRYMVRLPSKSNPLNVTVETQYMALKSLRHMHRRFQLNPQLALAYRDFMSIYIKFGHMKRIPTVELENSRAWYLPHHSIMQNSPLDRKIRVVFDASRLTREGQCLNDFLLAGPALQQELPLVLLNWRKYCYAFTTDIVKMFRQIYVAPCDQDLQRFLWSPSPEEPIMHYRLTTVTYGTACAPYLALRSIVQLIKDEGSRFPRGAFCLEGNTYVDDIFAGADNLSLAMQTQELTELLRAAGFELDKWAANHPELVPPLSSQCASDGSKSIDSDCSVKTLGLRWSPIQDEFRFTTSFFETSSGTLTKRGILSNVARLFDPLGWLAPITLEAKMLIQDLWLLKCGWDDLLPADIKARWHKYCISFSSLSSLTIPRWLGFPLTATSQIQGFVDASSRAYAAVIYLRTMSDDGRFHTSLLAARPKIAPVKTQNIPKLELCGAVLLVKLIRYVTKLEFLQNLPVVAWSDSQVVLMWLRKHPCTWKTFVANRVSQIQSELPNATWRHVPTRDNPADLATRGVTPTELKDSDLWWYGPEWLSKDTKYWPSTKETQEKFCLQTVARESQESTPPQEPEILAKFSSLTKLIRVIAFCL